MTRSGRLKTISSSEFRNLCRLCLINTNMKLHIFLDEGVQRQVHQKILNCLSLIVSEDDNLPKFVCYSCVNKLENFQGFRDLCHESENLLNSYLLSASKENHSVTKVEHPQDAWPSCAQQSSSQVGTSNEENAPSIRVDPTINVKVENDSEPSSECIVPDISHHVVIKKESNCESSRRGRTEGWVENPSSQICSSSQLNSIVSEASADLQKIGEVIITPVQVKQSIEMPNNVSDPCFNNVSDSRSCDMTDSAIFEDSDDDVQILDDDMEDGSAEVQDKVQAQIDSGEESKTCSLPYSRRKLPRKNFLEVKHPYFELSNVVETTRASSDNRRSSRGDRVAQPLVKDLEILLEHKTRLTSISSSGIGSQPLPTLICNGTVSQEPSANLNFGQCRDHVCEICNKCFGSSGELKVHFRIHTGERPFKCKLCEKSFLQKGHLKNHLMTHSGEKPFPCNICGKRFSRKFRLFSHFLTHRNM